MMAHNVFVILNEMRLPPSERASPPLAGLAVAHRHNRLVHAPRNSAAQHAPQASEDPPLIDDEKMLAKVLQKHKSKPVISVTQAGGAVRQLLGRQQDVARVFGLAERLDLGIVEGEVAQQGKGGGRQNPLRFVRNGRSIPAVLRDRFHLDIDDHAAFVGAKVQACKRGAPA